MDWIDETIRDLCELPDRSSPDDDPEAIVVTANEIRMVIEANYPDEIERLQQRIAELEQLNNNLLEHDIWRGDEMREYEKRIAELEQRGEPVAWINRSGIVIRAENNISWAKLEKAMPEQWKPLYLAAPSPEDKQ